METIIKISNHSCYDNGITSDTENISSIIDKLIRLTAKLTENYASDIIYDIKALCSSVETGTEIDNLLFFRENGVTTRETKDFNVDAYKTLLFNFTPIQIWRLTHNPSTMETKLIRVSIYNEYAWR